MTDTPSPPTPADPAGAPAAAAATDPSLSTIPHKGPHARSPKSGPSLTMDGFSLPVFPKESTDRTPTDVIVKLRDTLKQNPADLKTRIRLAAALDSAGEASEAEDVLRAALQRKQKTPEVFRALGMVYLRNQVYTGAIDAYLAATKLEPNNFDSRFKLGAAFAYLGMTEEARREFEIARKLNPDNPEVYIGLAFINNGQDRYPYAVKYLLEYIKRAPEPGNGYGLLSRVYLNMRVFDKAMRAGESAVKLMPDNPYVWYNLGQAYLYQPNNKYLPQAVDALLKAVNYSPNWASANFELGRAYARLGKTTDAIASYRSAVDAEPTSGRYKYQLGQLLVKSGQTEEGNRMVADASRLIRLNQRETRLLNQLTAKPNDTTRLYELSQIYKQLGDFGRAASVLRTLLSVNPNDDRARAEHRHLQALAAKRS